MTETEEYLDIVAEQRAISRNIRRLESRALLDPNDPEGLDEDEMEHLQELKQWEP